VPEQHRDAIREISENAPQVYSVEGK